MDEKKIKIDMKKYMIKTYGKRCEAFIVGCTCCEAWACFDRLFPLGSEEILWERHLKKSYKK